MTDYREAALNYLRYVLEQTGETPSSLAKRAGISTTTLTRPLYDTEHKYKLSMGTLQKIMGATGHDPAPFLSKDLDSLARAADTLENYKEYLPSQPSIRDEDRPTEWTVVYGEAETGRWLEHRFLPEKLDLIDLVHGVKEVRPHSIGMIVKGSGINKLARDGDVLFCVLPEGRKYVYTSLAPLEPGQFVIVERKILPMNYYEVSCRLIRRAPDGEIMLCAYSDDPAHANSNFLLQDTAAETIKIVAHVVSVVRAAIDKDVNLEGMRIEARILRGTA